jgi:hypothetical protein
MGLDLIHTVRAQSGSANCRFKDLIIETVVMPAVEPLNDKAIFIQRYLSTLKLNSA